MEGRRGKGEEGEGRRREEREGVKGELRPKLGGEFRPQGSFLAGGCAKRKNQSQNQGPVGLPFGGEGGG